MAEQHRQVIQKFQEREEVQKAREEEKRKFRKKNIYNARFADKKCWRCLKPGHLIYWCPDIYY